MFFVLSKLDLEKNLPIGDTRLINVKYRQSGTTIDWTDADDVTIQYNGIVIDPIPYYLNIPDGWAGIELQAINTCNPDTTFTQTINV